MLKTKEQKGITLIALVVTIIILLILSGVIISLTLGENGIFKKAKEAKDKYLTAQAAEEEMLNELYKQIGLEGELPENTPDTEAGTIVAIPNNWKTNTPNYVLEEDGSIVKKTQVASTVYGVSDGIGNTIPVPLGFYYVGGTISSGVVISDDSRDQNKYVNAKDGNVPPGVKYNEDGTVKTYTDDEYKNLSADEKKAVLMGNQFVWIPVSESEYKKTAWKNGNTNLWNATYETSTHGTELPQIQKYSGFYIGRYEAGTSKITLSTGIDFASQNTASSWANDKFSIRDGLNHTVSGNISTKAGEIPYYHADYFTALKLSNSMYNTNYVQSVLVTGTMWDAMMKFIADGDDTVVTNSSWGNYTNGNVTYTEGQGRYGAVDPNSGAMTSAFTKCDGTYHYGIKTTAISEDVKKKNLYDVAGNLWEWTQEASYANNAQEAYTLRGGMFTNTYLTYPASYRCHSTNTTNTDTSIGFRPALYIK